MIRKAIIFDYDDTLVNTKERLVHVFKTLYGEEFELFRKELYNLIPCEFDKIYTYLRNNNIEKKSKSEFFNLFFSLEPDKTELQPWVPELINHLFKDNFKFAICSSNDYSKINTNLKRLGIREYFEPIISRDSGLYKPDPQLIQLIREHFLRIDSSFRYIYIGDSIYDLNLARNSSIPFINVNDFKEKPLKDKLKLINTKIYENK